MIFSWQTKLIALGAFMLVAFGGGWKTRDAFCDAAAAKKEVRDLKTQLEAAIKAAEQDAKRAEEDAAEREKFDAKVRELESRIGAGECFSAADTDELRRLWSPNHPRSGSR